MRAVAFPDLPGQPVEQGAQTYFVFLQHGFAALERVDVGHDPDVAGRITVGMK